MQTILTTEQADILEQRLERLDEVLDVYIGYGHSYLIVRGTLQLSMKDVRPVIEDLGLHIGRYFNDRGARSVLRERIDETTFKVIYKYTSRRLKIMICDEDEARSWKQMESEKRRLRKVYKKRELMRKAREAGLL